MIRFARFAPVVCTLVALWVSGCGGTTSSVAPMPDYGSEEGIRIAEAISTFNEAKADQAKFRKMFASNVPSNWKDYEKHAYQVEVGSPKVNGNNATATVSIRKDENFEEIAKKEWTFTKVGDAWKIQNAPLQ